MINNKDVVIAFWLKDEPTHSKSMYYSDNKLFSYGTCILQRANGLVIGNATKYSHTTSVHQKLAGVYGSDAMVHDVPRGTADLLSYAKQQVYELDMMIEKAGVWLGVK